MGSLLPRNVYLLYNEGMAGELGRQTNLDWGQADIVTGLEMTPCHTPSL